MKVFVAGSRGVTSLNAEVRRQLDRIVEKQMPVVVGDAAGADKAVQAYLHAKGYDRVEVFCAGARCRYNVGGWPVRSVPANGRRKDFSFYAMKDQGMADEAAYGLMIWDGNSVGTLMNVARLVRQGKRVVVHKIQSRRISLIGNEAEWRALIADCPAELRRRAEREWEAEGLRRGVSTAMRAGEGELF